MYVAERGFVPLFSLLLLFSVFSSAYKEKVIESPPSTSGRGRWGQGWTSTLNSWNMYPERSLGLKGLEFIGGSYKLQLYPELIQGRL